MNEVQVIGNLHEILNQNRCDGQDKSARTNIINAYHIFFEELQGKHKRKNTIKKKHG
jgi:hypothetical protein